VIQIVVMILKIIGIIILALLGTLFGVLLTVLLVPVRYRLFAEWKNELYLQGTVSWLLHLIHTRIAVERTKPHIIIRILGFIIYDSEKPRKSRTQNKKFKKKSVKKKVNLRKTKNAKDSIPTKVTKYDKETIINTKSNTSEILSKEHEIKINKKEAENKIIASDNRGNIDNLDSVDNIDNIDNVDNIDNIDNINNIVNIEDTGNWKTTEDTGNTGYVGKIEKITSQIRYFYRRIKAFFGNLIHRLKRIFQSFLNFREKSRSLIKFFKDEMNKEGFRFTFSRIRKLLKHILPTKLKASILFGTGDPCSTGQILGLLGILYSFYGDKLQVTPDFENRRLEGWLDARGRIRLITILIIVIKLILDRRFKQLKNNWITLKEAL